MFDRFHLDDNTDPEKLFNNCIDNFYDTSYFSRNEAKHFLKQSKNDNISVFHLNIRFVKKNIDSLKTLLSQLNF